jgi:hypothetical protein
VGGVRSGALAPEALGQELGDFPLDALREVFLAPDQVGRGRQERGAGASFGFGRWGAGSDGLPL